MRLLNAYRAIILVVSFAITFVLPSVVAAQDADRAKPIAYGARELTRVENRVSLRGAAEFRQGDTRLRAEVAEAHLSANGALDRVEVSGGVFLVTPDQTIRADRGTYTVRANLIVLVGDVVLVRGPNVLSGGRLTYNVTTGAAQMDSVPNGRVRGVFYPGTSSSSPGEE